MASTNSTTYYELPQYISTDKPTYLTDWNQAMGKIDAGIHSAKAEADTNASNIGDLTGLNTSAKSTLVAAINEVAIGSSSVGSLSNLTTSDKTSIVNALNEVNGKANTIGSLLDLNTTIKTSIVNAINEVNSNIGDLSTLNTSVKSNAVGAINEVLNNLNFTTFKRFTPSEDFTYSQNNINMGGNILNLAKNSDGSYCKFYGVIIYNGTGSTASGTDTILTISNTGITPTEEFTVNCLGIKDIRDSSSVKGIERIDVKFKTNGNIEINLGQPVNTLNYKIILSPCIIQVKSFGDQQV